MPENWSITIITFLLGLLQTVCVCVMSGVIRKLDKISERLCQFVTRDECDRKSCSQMEEINNLWKNVRHNEARLAHLEGRTEGVKPPCVND